MYPSPQVPWCCHNPVGNTCEGRLEHPVDFLLKGGNVGWYIANARTVRSALTEKQHRELEHVGKARFIELFPSR